MAGEQVGRGNSASKRRERARWNIGKTAERNVNRWYLEAVASREAAVKDVHASVVGLDAYPPLLQAMVSDAG